MNEDHLARLHNLYQELRKVDAAARAVWQAQLAARDAALAADLAAFVADIEGALGATVDDDELALAEVLDAPGRRQAERGLRAFADGDDELHGLPRSFDGFTLLHRLGQGGMGVVFEAEQDAPRRRVALKVMQPTIGRMRLRRFEQEAAVLARLHHRNIAQIFASGAFEHGFGEQPYFAMELIEGVDLVTHCDRHHLDRSARLELIAQVADGVQHAHERGIVHRDLKPDNVLVDGHGTPKILDFGVAQARDSSLDQSALMTRPGELIGTLTYMAPEQLTADHAHVTARSDVYALGVMLHEVLCGRLPHEVADLPIGAAIELLTTRQPPPLSQFDKALRGDLSTIVERAIAKVPERRYASAAAFAADLRRHLQHLPIHARPATWSYRALSAMRRHRGLALGLGAAFFTLAAGLASTLWQVESAGRQRDQALQQSYAANLLGASDALARGELRTAQRFLDTSPEALRGWEHRELTARLDPSIECHAHDEPFADTDQTYQLVLDPAGESYWTTYSHRTSIAARWRRGDGAEQLRLTGPADGAVLWLFTNQRRRLWQLALAAASTELTCRCWDTVSGEPIPVAAPPAIDADCGDAWKPLDVTPDGRRILLASATGLALWGVPEGALVRRVSHHAEERPYRSIASHDGALFALAVGRHDLLLLDSETLAPRDRAANHRNVVRAMSWSRTGLIATASSDQTVRVWDTTTTPMSCRWVLPHPLELRDAAFTPDGRQLVTACFDRQLRLFDVATGALRTSFATPERPLAVTFFDNATVASLGEHCSLRTYDLDADATVALRGHAAPVEQAVRLPAFGAFVSAGWDANVGVAGSLKLWDTDSGEWIAAALPAQQLVLQPTTDAAGRILCLPVLSPSPAGQTCSLVLFDTGTGEYITTPESSACALLSPNGDEVLAIDATRMRIFAPTTGTVRVERLLHTTVSSLRSYWSRTGAWIALHVAKHTDPAREGCWLLDAATLQERQFFGCAAPAAMAVSADERLLALADADGEVLLFDLATGDCLATLDDHDLRVFSLAFSPDGCRLASGSLDRSIRLWDLQTMRSVGRLVGHEDSVMDLRWDGPERLLSAAADDTVRVWSTAPMRDRVAARAARRGVLPRMQALVDRRFDELRTTARVFAALDADVALSELERKVARQLALGRAFAAISCD